MTVGCLDLEVMVDGFKSMGFALGSDGFMRMEKDLARFTLIKTCV